MDYVVFGIGFGATILVLGLLLRDVGPRLRFRKPRDGGDILSAEELVAKVSWSRFCAALGFVLALAGAAFLLVTLVSMMLVLSDDTGLWVMASAFGLLLIVMASWTWAYFHRFGSYGILPERVEKPKPAEIAAEHGPAAPQRAPGTSPAAKVADADTENGDTPFVAADAAEAEAADTDEEAEPREEVTAGAEVTVETDTADPSDGTDTHDESDEPRLETPEERLAHAETPMNHGSAEADLGLAASGPRRPATRGSAPPADAPGTDARETVGPPVPPDLDRA